MDVDKAAEAILNGANVNATIEECGTSGITPLLYTIDNISVFTADGTVERYNDGEYFCNWSALLYAHYSSAGVTRFLLENGARTDIKLECGAETILD